MSKFSKFMKANKIEKKNEMYAATNSAFFIFFSILSLIFYFTHRWEMFGSPYPFTLTFSRQFGQMISPSHSFIPV